MRSVSTIARLKHSSVCHQTAAFLWSKEVFAVFLRGEYSRFGDLLKSAIASKGCAPVMRAVMVLDAIPAARATSFCDISHCAKTHTQNYRTVYTWSILLSSVLYIRARALNCVTCKSQLFRCKRQCLSSRAYYAREGIRLIIGVHLPRRGGEDYRFAASTSSARAAARACSAGLATLPRCWA